MLNIVIWKRRKFSKVLQRWHGDSHAIARDAITISMLKVFYGLQYRHGSMQLHAPAFHNIKGDDKHRIDT